MKINTFIQGENPKKFDPLIISAVFVITAAVALSLLSISFYNILFSIAFADLVSGVYANHTKSTSNFWKTFKYRYWFVPVHAVIYLPILFLTSPNTTVFIVSIFLLLVKLGLFSYYVLLKK